MTLKREEAMRENSWGQALQADGRAYEVPRSVRAWHDEGTGIALAAHC